MSTQQQNQSQDSGESEREQERRVQSDDPIVTENSTWWVLADGYTTKNSRHIHLPNAIQEGADGDATDPDAEPPAETLCHTDNRDGSRWQTKSHAVFPPGYRTLCSKCGDEIAGLVGDETETEDE